MRTTSNPAFRNLPGGGQGGYAGFGSPQQGGVGYPAPPTADRTMTVDDVVTKTAVTLATAVVAGGLTMYFQAYSLLLPAVIVGLVLSLIIIFKQVANPALVLAYSAAEGVALGAFTGVFQRLFNLPGLAFQAILGTFSVFAVMLVVYRTGAVKVTPRLTKWVIGATAGAALLMLLNLVLSLFHINLGVRDFSPLSIVISLVFIGIAAFNFLLDFDQADRALRSGAPAKFAWYIAFGLMTTLVWLYLEMVRLLASLQRN